MQEEVSKKTVNLALTTTKLSARVLVKGLALYMRHRKEVKAKKAVTKPVGKQSVKELIGQNQGVSSMPIDDTCTIDELIKYVPKSEEQTNFPYSGELFWKS